MTTGVLMLAAAFSISADRPPTIVVEPGMSPFVARTADDLAGDIEWRYVVRDLTTGLEAEL